MNWDDIIGGLIRIAVGRPKFRPKPVRPVKPPAPQPGPVPPVVPVPVPPPTPIGPPIDGSTARALYAAINDARYRFNRPALFYDPEVSALAAAWAMRDAASGVLTHGDFPARIATVRPGKLAGEDIGFGFATADDEVQGWMSDDAHRANVLGNYSAVGCGVSPDRDGRLYFIADFVL